MDVSPRDDLYAVLGVRPDASGDAIRRAYRDLARRLHPDVNAGAGDAFKRVSRAYGVLGDTARRSDYDRTRTTLLRPAGPAPVRRAPGPTGDVGHVRPRERPAAGDRPAPERAADEWRALAWVGRWIAAAVVGTVLLIACVAFAVRGGDGTAASPGPSMNTFCQTPDGWVDCRALDPPLP